MEHPIIVAFLLGIGSTLHCAGMCGGIMGALSLSLPREVRDDRFRLLRTVLAYSTGRIASYALAGALAGTLGAMVLDLAEPGPGAMIVRLVAAVAVVGAALYLLGWLPGYRHLERLGAPVWRRLQPLGGRLLPVRTSWKALAFGAIWGWIPCGLVYTALLWAVPSGTPAQGAMLMLAFGVGTLPAALIGGVLGGRLRTPPAFARMRRAIGILATALALYSVAYTGTAGVHHQHATSLPGALHTSRALQPEATTHALHPAHDHETSALADAGVTPASKAPR